jgi:hypothetical protein
MPESSLMAEAMRIAFECFRMPTSKRGELLHGFSFEAQFEVYQSYSPTEALSHWRDNGWICGDDAQSLAAELADAITTTNTTCLNLRIHAPGIAADAAREQIAALGTEVLPRLRALLTST